MLERLHLQVGDRLAGDVRDAHSEGQRVDQVADHDIPAELRLGLCVVGVQVERMVVHGEQAEEMVVGLGDGLARPVLVRRADFELFQKPAELRHREGPPAPLL